MKNRLLTALLALLLSCCIAIGPTAALAGVYALPLSWEAPVLCWAVSFLLGLLLLPRKRGGTARLLKAWAGERRRRGRHWWSITFALWFISPDVSRTPVQAWKT